LAGKLVLWANDYVQENHLSGGDSGLVGSVHAMSLNNMSLDGQGRVLDGCDQPLVCDRHLVFYCVVQAACYVLCFHGTSLAASHSDSAQLRAAWERVLSCELDPLRYCIKTVKWEFVRLVLWVGLVSEQCQQNLLVYALRGMRVCRRDSEVSVPPSSTYSLSFFLFLSLSLGEWGQSAGIRGLDRRRRAHRPLSGMRYSHSLYYQ